jgi:redox-regulated HSP33 family molecular chaperone
VSQALVALGTAALRQIVAEQQSEQVRCEFCATEYLFTPPELVNLLREALAVEQHTAT